ncbi:branched-chain amino acid ABC transporter [Striga asiatica]|uniref:Branched-chain amino acid ABC transporter n=1 Tax=Striga asiatica TaxID=4170 RepID=A0A5A7PV28_STRAF|nr:branched-chain amino acid ABC transporter [Striga asiatica]
MTFSGMCRWRERSATDCAMALRAGIRSVVNKKEDSSSGLGWSRVHRWVGLGCSSSVSLSSLGWAGLEAGPDWLLALMFFLLGPGVRALRVKPRCHAGSSDEVLRRTRLWQRARGLAEWTERSHAWQRKASSVPHLQK